MFFLLNQQTSLGGTIYDDQETAVVSKINCETSARSPLPPAPLRRCWPMDRWSPGATHDKVETVAWNTPSRKASKFKFGKSWEVNNHGRYPKKAMLDLFFGWNMVKSSDKSIQMSIFLAGEPGVGKCPILKAIGHHLIVAIIDHIPNGWVMFNGDI